jgi:hypothetical protein
MKPVPLVGEEVYANKGILDTGGLIWFANLTQPYKYLKYSSL